jgi:hypothetical protein
MGGYEVRESMRARRLSITVHPDGRVVLTKPFRVSLRRAHAFTAEHEDWIERTLARLAKRKDRGERIALLKPRRGTRAYKEAREQARELATETLDRLNVVYRFRYGTISIRDQKTRWGSCSVAGNLSFNYRLALLPPELAEYVVAHELCHVGEHNHSPRFWALVAKTVPDYAARRALLRRYE